jgi:hypothetical protein
MFGGSKKKLLSDGAQAVAAVTNVEYATTLGMNVAQNYNYKLDLTLLVRPENDAPFEAHVKDYFSQFAQPNVGDQFWVRYDPDDKTRVEIDQARIDADNAAAKASLAASAASAVPPDLAANGIPGRGSLVDVVKLPAGQFVDCVMTVGVRLIDGTAPYRASCRVPLDPATAEHLIPGQTFFTVRADPNDHSRIAMSMQEPTPVVTVTDPAVIDPPARALREGVPDKVAVLVHARQWLATPDGDELYAVKVKLASNGAEFQVNVPVPESATELLQNGTELPAKRLAADPTVLAIDWTAARGAAA